MWRNRGEIVPGPGATFSRGTGNARIFGARLRLPSILHQSISHLENRGHLIASMHLPILSGKPSHLPVFIIFTSRGLNSTDILKKVCIGIGAKSNPGPEPIFALGQVRP